eukprot:Skav209605  [mRNA]  locus=scaffold1634:134971:141973:+ [translate_table: standard]
MPPVGLMRIRYARHSPPGIGQQWDQESDPASLPKAGEHDTQCCCIVCLPWPRARPSPLRCRWPPQPAAGTISNKRSEPKIEEAAEIMKTQDS